MTRSYALRKLLEHGPLTMAQISGITRWTIKQADSALACLEKAELLRIDKPRYGKLVYSLSNEQQ